jgi:Leucine-rich repeat (LRR) protein
MISAVTLEDGKYGRRAVVTGTWSDRFLDEFARDEVVELELNQGKGWAGKDLSFLDQLPGLKSFEIFDFNITDVESIHRLRKLKRLGVTTYCSTAIEFSAFPDLEICTLEWRPKANSVFQCTTLKDFFINRYKGEDTEPFGNLVHLESLQILNSPVASLDGLRTLSKLRTLRLANLRCLKSLAGIESLAHLDELEIHTCRGIGSIEEVGSLSQLKRLNVNNCGSIESFRPLTRLHDLEMVVFYESTNILDGDLSPLTQHRNLTRVSFQNRRHYSHRREAFQ